jgi:hypothetical protein
MWVYLL